MLPSNLTVYSVIFDVSYILQQTRHIHCTDHIFIRMHASLITLTTKKNISKYLYHFTITQQQFTVLRCFETMQMQQ